MTTRQALVLCAFQLIDVSFFSTIEAHLLLLVIGCMKEISSINNLGRFVPASTVSP
jgi:hypothetical protein